MILKAALDGGRIWTAVVFLTGLGIVFVGALRHVIPMAWGSPEAGVKAGKAGSLGWIVAFGPLLALLALGLWMPDSLRDVLAQAARVLGARP